MIIEDSYLIRFIDSIRLNIDDKDEFLRTKLNKDTEVEVYQKAIWLGIGMCVGKLEMKIIN